MIHPIELDSYEILRQRVDLTGLSPGVRAVVERVLHASADLGYATSLVADEAAVQAAVTALRAGALVLCDVQMVRAGVSPGPDARCYLPEIGGPSVVDEAAIDGLSCVDEAPIDGPAPTAPAAGRWTRSAAAMTLAAERHPDGALVVVGCAPTALDEAVRLAAAGVFRPAVVVGMPVGFVGAAESKARLRESGLPAISNVGEKGGSAVAAAVVNALWRLSRVP